MFLSGKLLQQAAKTLGSDSHTRVGSAAWIIRYLESRSVSTPAGLTWRNLDFWAKSNIFRQSCGCIGQIDDAACIVKGQVHLLFLRGWLFHLEEEIKSLRIFWRDRYVVVRVRGIERQDVSAAFPLLPVARNSGFIALLPDSPAMGEPITTGFRVVLANDRTIEGNFPEIRVDG